MPPPVQAPSARQVELLDAAYRYVLEHGLADLSLRPLAAAIGTSPRVLLFLFGSKDGLLAALLDRARTDELAVLDEVRGDAGPGRTHRAAGAVWAWLAAPQHRPLLTLWLEAYTRSLVEPDGPWADFAARTVHDWLAVLGADADAAPETHVDHEDRTLLLAVLRGALLDLLATGDADRTTRAVQTFIDSTDHRPASPRWAEPSYGKDQ